MDAHDLFVHRHREHAEGVVLAQIRLRGEGKFREVGERLQVLRLHARSIELPAVGGDVVVGVR
jgi:hypothetical protein